MSEMEPIRNEDQILVLPSVSYRRRDLVPDDAGLYCFVWNDEEVLYVGMSIRSMRHRVAAHHRAGTFADMESATRIAFIHCDDVVELTGAERQTILALRPRFNVQWKRPVPLELDDGREKVVITTTQAAAYLNVTRAAVQKAVQDGRIASVRLGRDWAIEREEVERYRRERKLTGPRKQQP